MQIVARHNYEQSAREEAQIGKEGKITYVCTRCGDSYYEILPALPEINNNSAVLLVQDNLPWAEDVNVRLLKTLLSRGTIQSYNVVSTSGLSSVSLTDYGVIFIANDQSSSTYTRLNTYSEALNGYAKAGGILIFGACDEGWGGCGSFNGTLPLGVTTTN